MKRQICKILLLVVGTSVSCFASENLLEILATTKPAIQEAITSTAPEIASNVASAAPQIASTAASEASKELVQNMPKIVSTVGPEVAKEAAPGYLDWLANRTLGDIASGASGSVQNIGACALTGVEALASQGQPIAQGLSETWSSLPRETQQVVLGGAILAAAAYNAPTLYHYLAETLEGKKNRILNLAKSGQFIAEYPLSKIQTSFFPPHNLGNLYAVILNSFHKIGLVSSPRGDLLFFKYLKAFTEDEIYDQEQRIQNQLAAGELPASSFMQRWVIGRSEEDYIQLKQLISFNKDLTDIIAQLEKQIAAELKYY